MKKTSIATALLFCLAVNPVLAHRLNVFAYIEGNQICVESGFAGGRAARDARVIVETDNGKAVWEGKTDTAGKTKFPIPANLNAKEIKITVKAGEGHQNSWKMSLADQTPSDAQPQAAPTVLEKPVVAPVPSSNERLFTESEVQALLKKERDTLEKETIAPLRRQVAMSEQKQIGLNDIVGGIGWLVGLGGFLAWYSGRRKQKT